MKPTSRGVPARHPFHRIFFHIQVLFRAQSLLPRCRVSSGFQFLLPHGHSFFACFFLKSDFNILLALSETTMQVNFVNVLFRFVLLYALLPYFGILVIDGSLSPIPHSHCSWGCWLRLLLYLFRCPGPLVSWCHRHAHSFTPCPSFSLSIARRLLSLTQCSSIVHTLPSNHCFHYH